MFRFLSIHIQELEKIQIFPHRKKLNFTLIYNLVYGLMKKLWENTLKNCVRTEKFEPRIVVAHTFFF
jgi:hypothetical protein